MGYRMELLGILAAVLSSAFGGTAIGATRYLAGALDPITMGAVRFGGGFLILSAIAVLRRDAWPAKRDWLGATGLGLLFFFVFPFLFNLSLHYTTSARGALSLSTLPLVTMLVAALLRVERPSPKKLLGVSIAMAGVAMALSSSTKEAPPMAWRGDLLMFAAAFCMAFYTVGSRSYVARSGPIPFTAFGMGIGSVCLIGVSVFNGGMAQLAALQPAQWCAALYLAVIGGAAIFFLWAFAISRTTPTLVAISITVNPITASLFGLVVLDESIEPSLVFGLFAVLAGIVIAYKGRAQAKE